jgi:hypothetical protein
MGIRVTGDPRGLWRPPGVKRVSWEHALFAKSSNTTDTTKSTDLKYFERSSTSEAIMQTPKHMIHLSLLGRFGCQTLICAAFAATLPTASIAAPDGPPKLNVGPSCDAAARGSVVAGRNTEACLADENVALDVLKKNWSQYAPTDRVLCVGMNRTGGASSYVELQSCLEILRDAKVIRNDEIADPLLNKKGELDTRALMPADLDEGNQYTVGRTETHHGHKRNHRE